METLLGMAFILGGIGGVVGLIVAVITVVISAPDLYRSWRVLSGEPTRIDAASDGPVTMEGMIGCEAPLSALADAQEVVWRRLQVMEQVGTRTPPAGPRRLRHGGRLWAPLRVCC